MWHGNWNHTAIRIRKTRTKARAIKKIAEALDVSVVGFFEAIYDEKSEAMFDKFFGGDITPENITENQLREFFETAKKIGEIGRTLETEKEKWAIQEISKYLKKLNPIGQDEAVNRVEELTHSPKFKKLFVDGDSVQTNGTPKEPIAEIIEEVNYIQKEEKPPDERK